MSEAEALQDAGAGYPALVYSNWLDKYFPCRILATGAGGFLIEALYHGEAVKMRVPAAIVYRRPADGLQSEAVVKQG